MLPGSRVWDEQKIGSIFNDRDRDLILSIPLSFEQSEDKWYWLGDKAGVYSVRGGYKFLHNYTETQYARARDLWKILWKIKATLKI